MTEKKKDVLQPVDEAARRQAKGLVRSARFAALGTIDPQDGGPSVSRVSLATTMDGSPVFLISRLSGHFTNLENDARCSLLAGEPGKGDPLAHPRLTLIGRAERVTAEPERTHLKNRYLRRHPKAQLYADFADFAFWRFTTARASLNAGFGKAYALSASDLATSPVEGLSELEDSAIAHMNQDHAAALDRYAALAGAEHTGWRLSGIDPEGLDLSRGDHAARLWFDAPLTSPDELRPVLVDLAKKV